MNLLTTYTLLNLALAACAPHLATRTPLALADGQFPTPPLLSFQPPHSARLIRDAEGGCRDLPYSACTYEDEEGFLLHFNEGLLVVKEFNYSRGEGPFGLQGEENIDIVQEIVAEYIGRDLSCLYNGEKESVCYTLLDSNIRIDFTFNTGELEKVRLYVTDFL